MLPKQVHIEGIMEQLRKIRDDNSAKTMHMTFEELKAYYKESLLNSEFKHLCKHFGYSEED